THATNYLKTIDSQSTICKLYYPIKKLMCILCFVGAGLVPAQKECPNIEKPVMLVVGRTLSMGQQPSLFFPFGLLTLR
uniref:hypothetical protein n=1 Tax=Prevotella sp. TaxID=59823 RepID=UPI004028CB6C